MLVVDDEAGVRQSLHLVFNKTFRVIEATSATDAIQKATDERPDVVLLDIVMPGTDGLEVLKQMRSVQPDCQIIMLSALNTARAAFAARTAFDYVTKPFGIHELLARVRAALRGRRQDGEPPPAVVAVGDLTIDIPRRHVRVAGAEVKLTRKEFAILRLLAQYTGRIVTHQHLLREVWGPAHQHETHYLRIYIGHLRQKLGDDPADPRYISNEPGVGYRLLDADSA